MCLNRFYKCVNLFLFLNKKFVFRACVRRFFVSVDDFSSLSAVISTGSGSTVTHLHTHTHRLFHWSSISQLVGPKSHLNMYLNMYLNPPDNIINSNPTKPVIQDLRYSRESMGAAFQHIQCCQFTLNEFKICSMRVTIHTIRGYLQPVCNKDMLYVIWNLIILYFLCVLIMWGLKGKKLKV